MNRLKLLAAVALLGIPLAACEEATPPPPVGSITGTVSIEGTGIDGVSVNLSNGNTTTTSGGGAYRFDNVEGGAYTVTISGYPDDADFDATSAAVTISSAGQSATANFSGTYIRTASIMGTVTVENKGLAGVTVRLSGVASATANTDASGSYAFTGLRKGDYRVEIEFQSDEIAFSATSSSVSVPVGESRIVSFEGAYLRTARIQGQVSVEGVGLEGVTVSLSGGPEAGDATTTTDASGQYAFASLRGGTYQVGISGYDTDDYSFEVTSQNVTVALGETASVPFDGILLRTSSISGQVSVEGVGHPGVTVTLSGGDLDADATATTDDAGVYAFASLAAGTYTVAISGYDADAYVFDPTSQEVTVAEDASATAHFDGSHATTASISGMLFVDEAAKNDSYDEGEDAFAAPGVPVVLVGPGINDRVPSATNEQGQFMFANLKAGAYQLVVTITPEVQAALGPYAYGGPSTGYEFDLGVGEAATQNVPFDITHQTVGFAVSLKSGDATGAALPGATVNLYADLGGKDLVGTGETGPEGMASITVERADAEGSTVYAGIEAEGYHVADEMQAVMWDPKSPTNAASNEMDIVNLTADVSFSGRTIETDVGGGAALAGWAIDVLMTDEDGEMVAVADTAVEVPAKLGTGAAGGAARGVASFTRTVEADGLGTTYYFSVAPDSVQTLDGGQEFTATPMASDAAEADGTMLKYVHDGLSLAGTVDLGTIEVQYTTQRLVVSVHQEKDQVPGYTRTISGGDSRPKARVSTVAPKVDAGISLELRHIDANGRSRPVPGYENRIRHPGGTGSVTFDKVPADLDIVVKASTDADRMIINNDEAQAYRDFEANKVWYFVTSRGVTRRAGLGAFGDQGGFHHTVSLCPETADDPDQDYQDNVCSTFAYVWTRDVIGDVMRTDVTLADDPNAGFETETTYHADISVSLSPVDRKNVQGDSYGATSASENSRTAARELGTYKISGVGDGDYRLSASSGWWDVTSGGKSYTTDEAAEDFAAPADVTINIVPQTMDIYGTITDGDGIEVADVEVKVGGKTATTDDYGRYVLDDVPVGRNKRLTVAKAGYAVSTVNGSARSAHAKANKYTLSYTQYGNTPKMVNAVVNAVDPTGTVTGTVTHLQNGGPIAGVRVFALKAGKGAPDDLSAPGLAESAFDFADVDTTDADGNYELTAPADALGGNTTVIAAYRSGMFFTPHTHTATLTKDQAITVNFQGLKLSVATGRVVDGSGTAMSGVTVTATGGSTGTGVTRTTTTNASGRYILRVPWGPYTITPTKARHVFTPASQTVTLAGEQTQTLQNFAGAEDGTIQVTLTVSATSYDESDAGGRTNTATITATLDKVHTADITVNVVAAPATGTDASDISGISQDATNPSTLTILAGSKSSDKNADDSDKTSDATLTLTGQDDEDVTNESFTVTATLPTGTATTILAPASATTMTVLDDDAAPSAPLNFTAATGTATNSIVLNWDFATDPGLGDGLAATITGYQARAKLVSEGAFTDAEASLWFNVGNANQSRATITTTDGSTTMTADVAYNIELRTTGSASGDAAASAAAKASATSGS